MCASGVRLRPVRVVQFPKRRRPTATHGDVMDCVHLTRHQCSREPTHSQGVVCQAYVCQAPWSRLVILHKSLDSNSSFPLPSAINVVQSCFLPTARTDLKLAAMFAKVAKVFLTSRHWFFLFLNFGCLCCLFWVFYGSFRNFYFCSCVNLHIRERNDGSNLNFRLDGWGG